MSAATDGQGIPLAVTLTGGNRNDVTQLLPLLDKIPAVTGLVGWPRHRPDALLADRGSPGATFALITLAADLPPTVLGSLLGISLTSALNWNRRAGRDWNTSLGDATARAGRSSRAMDGDGTRMPAARAPAASSGPLRHFPC